MIIRFLSYLPLLKNENVWLLCSNFSFLLPIMFLFLFLHNTQVKFELSYCSISYFVEKCQMWGFHALTSVSFDQILLKLLYNVLTTGQAQFLNLFLLRFPSLAGSRNLCPIDIFFLIFVFFSAKLTCNLLWFVSKYMFLFVVDLSLCDCV